MYSRSTLKILTKRTKEKRSFIQVLAGPRQTGKTTLIKQLLKTITIPNVYISCDEPMLKTNVWIEQQWETARTKIKKKSDKAILILDEIQKINNWSETVKKLWDEDTNNNLKVHVILLGSSPLLIQQRLTESLAGRFETIYSSHWSFPEMNEAFNWNIDKYIFYGGYPGSAKLINDPERWVDYIFNSLIETSISRDILLMTRIDKPILLRQLFELGCSYSGQVLSYQKVLGQLQDAGNTVTLAHYLQLLSGAGLLTGLFKYAGQPIRRKSSSPKFQVLNTALLSAQINMPLKEAKQTPHVWGRFVESTVGAHLANSIKSHNIELYYWAGYNKEVDFVLVKGEKIVAIEVKSSRVKDTLPGMDFFCREFKTNKKLLVGKTGIPIKEFLTLDPKDLF
ncbi:ATP-binding protein [bacterium]